MNASYRTLIESAGCVRLQRDILELTGKDVVSFLHNMTSNDIQRLQVGDSCEAFAASAQGKISGFFNALRLDDHFWLETAEGQAAALRDHLDRYVIREDVSFLDRSQDLVVLGVSGPQVAGVFAARDVVIPTEIGGHSVVELGELKLRAMRVCWLGDNGLLLVGDENSIQRFITDFADELPEAEYSAAEQLRIEHRYPNYGVDISDKNLPQEVDRSQQAISFTKGCYLGQETIARIDAMGHVNRKLCRLKFDSDQPIAPGLELLHGEKNVGAVTSAIYSDKFARPLALGYVRREACSPGTSLTSEFGTAQVLEHDEG